MDLIHDKYRVLKTLGQGAMGEVYLVLPPRGDPVALKLLKTGEGDATAAIQQFENEFKVLKKLSHPNIGRIHDYGYAEELGKVYFTSPWLKGTDLYVATKSLPFEKIEDLFVQMLRALNYLHQKGIIHCDLKPGNVFIENEHVQLIDFGLAGYWGESIVGTPTYLAPEIFRGERHTVASDLYAVGVMLYNCLTRTQPFSGKNLQEVYDRHRTHTPKSLTEINPAIPKYLSDIALTLLSKKIEERYSSAADVIEEIAAYSSVKYSVETKETLLSYLPKTSELIGRKDAQYSVEQAVGHFLSGSSKKPYVALYLYGEAGVGKSKFVSQIKTRLQLEKISVEEAILPLAQSDRKVLSQAKAIILEDLDHYTSGNNPAEIQDFVSLMEQKVLDTQATKLLLIVTGANRGQWAPFESLFPSEELIFEPIELTAFNPSDTRGFLETIIGQKGIPDDFVTAIHRNTGGNPGISQQIVENMIAQGLLFDSSGRWSADLIAHLSETLTQVETPRSLEERMDFEYAGLNDLEKEVLQWLSITPHGLSHAALSTLLGNGGELLLTLMDRNIIRIENGLFFLYRSVSIPHIQNKISSSDLAIKHAHLASGNLGLAMRDIWYHQSKTSEPLLVKGALEKLSRHLTQEGDRAGAWECLHRLIKEYSSEPLGTRVDWGIKAAELLIWLDRFEEAISVLTPIEIEVEAAPASISLQSRLLVWEKKGLALLHKHKIEDAESYFMKGVNLAHDVKELRVEEVRFLNDLAQVKLVIGHIEESIPKFEESRKLAASLSHDDLQKVTNNDLGHVYYRMRQFDEAIRLLEEDIRVFQTLPYREPLARAVYTLAECLRGSKRFVDSVRQYEKCVEICKRDNLLSMLLRAYNGLGNVHWTDGRYEEALESYQKAIEISVHLKDLTTRAALLANQGFIFRNQKNLPQATRRFLLAKQILESKGKCIGYELQLLSKCYSELAIIAREEQDGLKAISYQTERVRMVEESQTLKGDEMAVKLDLLELYLENRLEVPFERALVQLEEMVKTDEDKSRIITLKSRWAAIKGFEQDATTRMDKSKNIT